MSPTANEIYRALRLLGEFGDLCYLCATSELPVAG
jgi:hypothetical protein